MLLGSLVPVVPTGAVVGAAAAVAMTTGGLLAPVLLLAAVGALLGDLITFAVARFGGPAAVRWIARGQHPERLAQVREQFRAHGWLLVVVGRLLPAGRVPVLLAAGALAYPWRRLLPAPSCAAALWAVAYALLGVVTGGLFDDPLVASLVATAWCSSSGWSPTGSAAAPPQREPAGVVTAPHRPRAGCCAAAGSSRGCCWSGRWRPARWWCWTAG